MYFLVVEVRYILKGKQAFVNTRKR